MPPLFIDLETNPGGGSSGAVPSTARVWLAAAHADFAAGENLGALATGLVINTAGVPSVVAHGTNTHVLTMVGGVPTWAAPSGGVTSVTAGAGLTGGGTGAVTLNVAAADATITVTADAIAVGTVQTGNIADDAVTYAKLQNAATGASVLGKTSAGAGNFAEILSGVDGQILVRVGGSVNFGQLQSGSAAGTTTNGFVLTLVGGVPTWQAATGGVTGSGAANRVAIWSGASALTSDAGFTLASNTLPYTASVSGSAVTFSLSNSSNTASSHTDLALTHGGTSGGRVALRLLGGTREWMLGKNAGSNFIVLQDLTAVRDRWSINDTLMGFGHSGPTAHYHFVRPPGGGNNTNIQMDNDQAAGMAEFLLRNTASNVDLFMSANGGSTGTSRFDASSQLFAEVTSGGTGSAGLLVGTRTADPLVLGTDDDERFRIAADGSITSTDDLGVVTTWQ